MPNEVPDDPRDRSSFVAARTPGRDVVRNVSCDDISVVFFNIDTVRLNGIIVRPDTDTDPSCATPSYMDSDTVEVASMIPTEYPGLDNDLMTVVQGGLYRSRLLCGREFGCPAFPDFVAASDALGPPVKGCAFGEFMSWFGIRPPAVPSDLDAFLTHADVEYAGISAIVYDAAGNSALATFPDLRVIYTTEEEKLVTP